MATNGNTNHQEQYAATSAPADNASTTSTNNPPSKDEVGWYFVEQYYTTLSQNPGKLHLFYNKRSQFVQGMEAELANVAVGRQAIQERIKELDFQDCKVRVSNVDSQASFENIVIQVIGEISNKSGEPKKFVQTFVLAQQPQGYFLLNDILRYVNEGDDEAAEATGGVVSENAPVVQPEAPEEPAPQAEPEKAEAPEAPDAPEAPEAVEAVEAVEENSAALDAQAVVKKLEEASSAVEDTPSASVVDTPAEPALASEQTPVKTETVEPTPDPEKTAQDIAEEETKKAEVPKDPSPTPAPSRAPAPEPEKPKGPPKPMTWASRIAAAAGPVKPVVPLPPKAAAQPAQPAQPRPAAPAQANASAQPAQPAETSSQTLSKEAASEWRTAGADSKRQSRQHPTSTPPAEKEGTLVYVKFVTEKVKEDDLRATLGKFGELIYFDINRSKNCAFVEYATPASYQAALAASPIVVNGENILVEPRRPKAGAYGGANYNNRGSISGRGRGFDGQRSGSQGGGRGGYTGRGRGGAPRGRGGPQAANA